MSRIGARRACITFGFFCIAILPAIALAAPAHDDDDGDDDDVRPSAAPAEIVITAHRLDEARNTVEASLGAATFALGNDALENRPAGETTSIAQALLQAPGVAQIGKGRISVRGSPSGLQYRINNVILPDGVADLGEQLSPRLADRIELTTGALPAQYGLQVGGVVNIVTKNGLYGSGGQLELYGGSHGQFEPAIEYAGSSGATSYFATGSYLRDDVGLASPAGSAHPPHDRTDQLEGLAFVDHVIDSRSRVSLVAGVSNERFEIPEGPALGGADPVAVFSANPVDGGYQHQADQYGALSYQNSDEARTLQVSLFGRHSRTVLQPGASAGLGVTGLGGQVADTGLSGGVQVEGVFRVDKRHTLRIGGVVSHDTLDSRLDGVVEPSGIENSTMAIVDRDRQHRTEASFFLQDEWKPIDRLTVNFGARFDGLSGEVGGSSLGPRVNLVWSAAPGTVVHAGYARYLVAPNLYPAGHVAALAGTSAVESATFPSGLRLENDNYYDIGAQQKLGAVTVGIDAFWRDAQHLLSEREDGSPLLAKPFNYRHGRFRGIEASATYSEGAFAGWANFTFVDARATGIETGQAFFAAPAIAYAANHWVRPEGSQRFTATAGGTYRAGPFKLGAELLYGSGLSQDGLPGYVQANFDLTFRMNGIGGRPLDLRMDLINAFDRRYEIDPQGSDGVPQWGPRRGVFVGVEQAF